MERQPQVSVAEQKREKRQEMLTFLVVTVLLAPLLTATLIGAYGLIVWISHAFWAPPGLPVD